MNILLEILSKCPRYFNHGPAAEIWSVVHFPFTLIKTTISVKSLPSHLSNGSSNCKRCDFGSTSTFTLLPSDFGASYVSSPVSKPRCGNSSANGFDSLNFFPSLPKKYQKKIHHKQFFLKNFCFNQPVNWSVTGLKSKRPAILSAVTNSGDVTKACVAGFASLRPVKLRLYEVTIVFLSPFLMSLRSHCPIHGPQALAKT